MSAGTQAVATSRPAGAAALPLVRVETLVKRFPLAGSLRRRGAVHAVDGVDLDVSEGEVLALVGESGSGKSTLGRCILGLLQPTEGRVLFDGVDIARARGPARAAFRRAVQPVFQDPYSSLDPRWTVARTVRETLDAQRVGTGSEREGRVRELLEAVGLAERLGGTRPHELSGGQRQRAAIAAAIAAEPRLLVADEPVSALDVIVQAQILNLVARLRADLGLAIVFITHDLAVVEHLADRVAVMYLGRIVEIGERRAVLTAPRHPYTRALIDSIPRVGAATAAAARLRGEIPSPIDPPAGCHFHPRCPLAEAICAEERPALDDYGDGRAAACHVARARAFGAPGRAAPMSTTSRGA